MSGTNSRLWRWIALITVLLNVAFNNLYEYLPIGGKTIAQVTNDYPALFTPAGYAFAIWGVIYLAFIIYSIYQLLPSQSDVQFFDRLTIPFTLANLLGSIWIIIYTREFIALSLLIIIGMLCIGAGMFVTAKKGVASENLSGVLTVPFSLFFGWITVANIANLSIWLKASGLNGNLSSETTLTQIVIAVLLGVIIGYLFKDVIYPLVIAWASIAIWVARKADNSLVANAAMMAGILLVVWALITGIRLYKKTRKLI